MKLVQKPVLKVQDFPDEHRSWIKLLFTQINPFFTSLNDILNYKVDYLTNIPSVTNTYNINTFQPFSVYWPFSNYKPNHLSFGSCYSSESSRNTVLAAAWNYDSSSSTVNVTNMIELTEQGNMPLIGKYSFTMRVSI